MVNTFNNDKLNDFIHDFVTTVPGILRSNPLTADLVGKVDRLSEEIDTPFSLAVIGQMRIGKSSLMNGMIGKESAAVGVNETTATINFFKYREGEQKNNFRVHWKSKHYEDIPCTDIENWVGESENAVKTRYLEFFDDSDFFKEITLVDTPGTRSVIGDHSEMINSFLAEKRERETLQHGGKADAILYVSGAVANESAEDMLKKFQESTRLPGSSPYNSVAVLHKWETLNVERPHEEAHKKASLMEKQFQQFVAKVIPVSGPLALAAKTLSVEFWDALILLIKASGHEKLKKILARGDKRFKDRVENGGYLLAQSRLPWPCFKVIIEHAILEDITDGEVLRAEVLELSGIEALMSFIRERFIKKSTQIKSLSILTKAIEPCKTAQIRIRNNIAKKEELLKKAESGSTMLDYYIKDHKSLEAVSEFIQAAKKPFQAEVEQNKQTQIDLGNQTSIVEDCYDKIMGDLRTLALLDSNTSVFSGKEQNEIRHICGSEGLSAQDRVCCYGSQSMDVLIETVEEQIENWEDRGSTMDSKLTSVADHMVSRLEELADELENNGVAIE